MSYVAGWKSRGQRLYDLLLPITGLSVGNHTKVSNGSLCKPLHSDPLPPFLVDDGRMAVLAEYHP